MYREVKMENEYLTMDEVAQLLKVSRMTVYRWFKIGLRYHKLAHTVRIARADLDDFMMHRKRDNAGSRGKR